MDKLDNYKINELVLKVVNKEISVDDVLNTHYETEDYKQAYENRFATYPRFTGKGDFEKYYIKRNDAFVIYKQLIDASISAKELKDLEEKMDVGETYELDMSWDAEEISEHTNNIYDGLVLSINNLAKVDIDYISKVTNTSKDEVINSLRGIIFQNPETYDNDPYLGWETSDNYLSGNMFQKLNKALIEEEKHPGMFSRNIEAIKKIYPKALDYKEVYCTLGSPWVPTDVIDDFIVHLLGESHSIDRQAAITKHDKYTGTWHTTNFGRYYANEVAYVRRWGSKRCPALRIIEDSLNMRKPFVYDTKYGVKANGQHGDIHVLNKEETILAQEKQKQVIAEFESWVFSDEKRKERLLKIYEEKYASYVQRKYDGSLLSLNGLNPNIQLYDYQKNAIARIINSKNVLLAHDVGSGKTYEMIAAGMELRRIGLSKKNLYVVPNNIVGQWAQAFKELYPNSNVLIVNSKNFNKDKRNDTLLQIKNNDYDGIIMAYSCFDILDVSNQYRINKLNEEVLKITKSQSRVTTNTNSLDTQKKKLVKQINELKKETKDNLIKFDELGINRLFVDEAHNYKNVPIKTKMSNVMGVNAKGSKKCADMLDKVRCVQKLNKGGGVVMATATPVTNSICETYIMQLYLQSGELNLLELESFDSWAGMFAQTSSEYEIDVTTNTYRLATRFCKYHNLTELTNLLSFIADFHIVDESNGIPICEGYKDEVIARSDELKKFYDQISLRADKVRNRNVDIKEDNMLKITSDGRKAALDLRLIDDKLYGFNTESKVYKCAINIYKEYIEGNKDKTTQLVFIDSSTPKKQFNMYDELERILVKLGITNKEIAYIHDACDESDRLKLYEKVRKGEIRVLIGSTFKLGIGVNVQDKVKALHHLDIPWRPADMKQREGRILRIGNTNEKVNIYRYVTNGSFDAYSWQLLEKKQKFISDLIQGILLNRDEDEIDSTVLSYAEIKALAIGNPDIKKRVEILNEIERLKLILNKNNASKIEMQKELLEIPSRINIQKNLLNLADQDYEFIKSLNLNSELSKQEKQLEDNKRKDIRIKLDDAINSNSMMLTERDLMQYNGFTIKLPKGMMADKPYLYVQRFGRYRLDLSDSKTGNLIRLDNFFNSFEKVVNEFKNDLDNTLKHKENLENELLKKDETLERINELQDTLNELNERLGIY